MKKAQILISTQQNTVNVFPLLMEPFANCDPIIVSSQKAIKDHWTANLEFVLARKIFIPIRIDLTEKEETEEQTTDLIVSQLKDYDQVYFNISGGKKNLILFFLYAFQKRANKNDRIIYVDNNPTTVQVFEGYKYSTYYPVPYLLDLEDILNLYGFTCFQIPSQRSYIQLDDIVNNSKYQKVSMINKYFLTNNDFAILLYKYFYKIPLDIDDKVSISEKIMKVIINNKPTLQNCQADVDPGVKKSYETIFVDIKKLKEKTKRENRLPENDEIINLWKQWKHLSSEQDIFNRYWSSIKKQILHLMLTSISADDSILYDDSEKIKMIVDICRKITDKTLKHYDKIYHSDVMELLALDIQKGELFELMFTELIANYIKQHTPVKKDRFYFNVKVYNLGYTKDNKAFYQENEEFNNLVEFDTVFVTNYGTIIGFECKIFGFGGDVVKAKDQSAHLHGGVFSQIKLITHIQNKHLKNLEVKPYLPYNVLQQLEAVQKYHIDIWHYDEIEDKLEQILSD